MVPNFQDFLVADLVSSPPPCRWSRRSLSELGPGSSLSARLIVHRRPVETASREVTLSATCIATGDGAEGPVDGELSQTSNWVRGRVNREAIPKPGLVWGRGARETHRKPKVRQRRALR
jgi:hypothetical protein